jgi:anti-sigma B factor antagonist
MESGRSKHLPTGLEIDDRTTPPGHVTLKLTGELDADSVSVLERAAERHSLAELQTVTLDLRDLMFIDSTGLAALVLMVRLCERAECAVEIIPGPRAVQRLFEITGLIDVLPFREPVQP